MSKKKDLFITPDFLLQSRPARELYHEYAEPLPIIDFHSHLPSQQAAEDRRYENLAQVWLSGDHYKWRAMRANGVPEQYCTGDAPDRERFQKWAETVPMTVGNPLFHWTHLELKRVFGIGDRLLGPDTAHGIWEECRRKLATPALSSRGIMRSMNVRLVCTTDDPTDSLEHHKAIAADPSLKTQVLPTWRPDKGIALGAPKKFNAWVAKLSECSGVEIKNFDSYLAALRKRHDHFHRMGCRISDHGVEQMFAEEFSLTTVRAAFRKARAGRVPTPEEQLAFRAAMLHEFGLMDAEKGWTQQFHLGPQRNNSSRLLSTFGPDAGADSIGDLSLAAPLAKLLDRLDRQGKLPKTILYNVNPADSALMATMAGNFQDGSVPGKMQWGVGWWYADNKEGIETQLRLLGSIGLLRRFVGMVTDSRSFLSFTRHEYFRRLLCNLLGSWAAEGQVPADMKLLGGMVRDICYNNSANYFGFKLPPA